MSKPILTIAQIHALPEGEWANGEIFAVLSNPKPPRGKGPWSATLSDSTGSIVGKFWGPGGIEHWNGKRIKLSGAGMQRKAYQNVPELSVGQKADISFAGAPGTAAQEEDAVPGDPTPPTGYPFRPADTGHPPGHDAPKASGTPVNGQTVGMAVKAAVDIWIATGGAQESEGGFGQSQAGQIERIARDIVTISERIQSGEQP